MINNFVFNGSDIPEPIDIDDVALEYFGFPKPQKVLLVEGKTDKECIEALYYLEKRKLSFSIRTVSMIDEEENGDGKKRVLEYYKKNNANDQSKIKVLLDRDYDFILNLEKHEEDIFYYDYYELENYLFDKKVLKKFFCQSLKGEFQSDKVERILEKIESYAVQEDFSLFYKMCLFREINYNGLCKEIVNVDVEKFSKIIKKPPFDGILNGKIPFVSGKNIGERIVSFYRESLNNLQDNLFTIITDHFNKITYKEPNNFLDFCQFFFKGKYLISSFEVLLASVGIEDIRFSGNKIELLLRNLIYDSEVYKSKIFAIESSFNHK